MPAPFPAHRWADYIPDVVVLPTSAEQVSEVVKLANRERIPVVPRAGGTGLTDGAVPLRHGILVDVKLMNQIHEIDLDDRTVTVGPGINMLKLSQELQPLGYIYPDNPASYPCSLVGGRIGTSGWSLIGGRYGHTRDLVISFEIVLPTGEIIRVGDGGGRKIRKSSSGYQLKHLFMGHQGTLGIVTEATLELVPRPEAEFSAFFSLPVATWTGGGRRASFARAGRRHPRRRRPLRRVEARLPAPRRRGVHPAARLGEERRRRRHVRPEATRCAPGAKRIMRIAKENGRRYLGDEISQGDWASRHDRYATPLHGRLATVRSALMSWHCEDAAIPYSQLPAVREKWHRIVDDLRERYDTFDDWGMFSYTNGAFRPWRRLPDRDRRRHLGAEAGTRRLWQAWVDAKREIARVSIEHGGSITACHGSCREGEVDLVPIELGGGVRGDEEDQAGARPEQHHEPGQVPARPGLRGGGRDARLPALRAEAARGAARDRRRRSAATSTSSRSIRR